MTLRQRICFAPDGGGGGGGNGDDNAPKPQPNPAPASGGEDYSTRPDWLPEQFYNPETKGPRIKEMAKAWSDARAIISRGVEGYRAEFERLEAERIAKIRPATPEGYKVELPSDLGKKFAVLTGPAPKGFDPQGRTVLNLDTNSPLYKWWAQTAHKLGLGQADFNAGIASYIEDMASRAPDYEAELKALGERGPARVAAINAWMKANLTEASYKALEAFGQTAAGVTAIEEIMRNLGASQLIDTGASPTPQDGDLTEAQARELMKHPDYWREGPEGDKLRARVTAAFQKLYPGKVGPDGRTPV